MTMLPNGVRALFRLAVRRPGSVVAEVDDEIAFHLQERIDALVARGWSPDAAADEARRRFGDSTEARRVLAAAATQRERKLDMIDRLTMIRQDLTYAVRQLRRSPAFAFGSIAAFALGIGANSTMFNVLDRLLLRPPPHVRNADEVYTPLFPTRSFGAGASTSFTMFAALRDRLAGIAPVSMQSYINPVAVGRGADAATAQSVVVDGSYFRTLGTPPALGRLLGDDDARFPSGQPVVVLGHAFWRRQFGADPNVIGREIIVGAERVRVIGVTPEGFNGVGLKPIDLYVPVTMAGKVLPFIGDRWMTQPQVVWLFTIVRRSASATPAMLASGASAAFAEVQSRVERPIAGNAELSPILPSRSKRLSPEAKVASMLGAVSLLVLLIACANAANLMLARAVRRRRELGVRLALGGSHGRIAAHLLVDALFLAALGGVAAVVVAALGSAFMRSVLLSGYSWNGGLVDARTAAFIAIAVVVAGAVTGVVPSFLLRRIDVAHTIAEGRQEGGVHRHRAISSLVVAQTVLSVALLIGTVLFVRSLRAVREVPLGVDVDRTVVVSLDVTTQHLPVVRGRALFADLAARASRVPGVSSVAIADGIPFDWSTGTSISVPGVASSDPAVKDGANLSAVTSDYFNTIGTRIVDGRGFTAEEDRADGERVAVINTHLARLLWPSGAAVGHCVRLGTADSLPCRRIIGVAENTHRSEIVETSGPFSQVYVPLSQGRDMLLARVVVVRTSQPDVVMPLLRDAARALDADLPYPIVWRLGSHLDSELRPWRLGAIMFGAFGALSLAIATLGVYSVIAYSVAQRRREMGIRMALGAQWGQIVSLILRQAGRLVAGGALLGVMLAVMLAPFVQPMLYGTSARSPVTYFFVAAGMILVAVVACIAPASTAARTSPMLVIRSD